jgi:hypothetical protein
MRTRHSAIFFFCALPALVVQTEKIPVGDWPRLNRDLAGTCYSPLTQIDTKM